MFDNYLDVTFALDEMISLKSRTIFNKSQIAGLLSFESLNEQVQRKIFDEKAEQTMKSNEAEIERLDKVKQVKKILRTEVEEIHRQVNQFVIENEHRASA